MAESRDGYREVSAGEDMMGETINTERCRNCGAVFNTHTAYDLHLDDCEPEDG